MSEFNFISRLHNRGLISHITNEDNLSKLIENKSISLYCGFDPTEESLHIGHLLPLIMLKRFQIAGHRPIILIGGATSLIGDPSFKEKERVFNSNYNVNIWTEKITKQISCFLDFNCGKNSAVLLNNNTWFKQINILSFLRDVGKYFSVNTMINRAAVKQRITRPDQGISFTEFSYNLLQAYDFFILNQQYQADLQIGGADQWGNISSGMHLIHRKTKRVVYGLTVPLLIQSNGIKFGKTESGTIWLDSNKTSPYKFYQFWMNIEDANVYYFLKLFTFIKVSEINKLEKNKNIKNQIINDKSLLAKHITQLVHGKEKLLAAERITKFLFLKNTTHIEESDLQQLKQDGIPFIEVSNVKDLQEALVLTSLAQSRTQAKNMIISNSISINTEKIRKNHIFHEKDKLFGKFTLLSRGKKQHSLLCW
ncbi:tyrosine--tRNA ligase [Buchnera aphidicola str. APS (Acyrthosiphon pisum)]|uniref:Tyrosine--tRNA ligase n=1 Tax=Buchnera aphidicola subsp. Acyrthosiphon pisum (strain APS) TaxID=107806 RepID=SYY_BUCAI|nr:tyrosine--tRNA ligase [Buchnera aphidicola]P57221.1 RecName: Full=Tyrosine--tRNA ligase; AltName: Full=Tyrosyl-tRNA synthetase; Short=TyrRS [Buchnera aphidicola str. APS (Acyrthosiphon pisum)]pir/G84943/ tyrosine-tRNA ligase (EC 6.1.1.1) [imported] - Buchnera sp. (strain APS) [Buchnera sp. (in: enterobacteria)]BAB12839.1 tyrosyl-tRNA synthetase [Buchnera aphidicola str. APS (Acyrthosiphon pisum)]